MAYFRHLQYLLSLNQQIQVCLLFSANHVFWLPRLIGKKKNITFPFFVHIQYNSLNDVRWAGFIYSSI